MNDHEKIQCLSHVLDGFADMVTMLGNCDLLPPDYVTMDIESEHVTATLEWYHKKNDLIEVVVSCEKSDFTEFKKSVYWCSLLNEESSKGVVESKFLPDGLIEELEHFAGRMKKKV